MATFSNDPIKKEVYLKLAKPQFGKKTISRALKKKNPGFKAVQAKIADEQDIPSDRAGAILAASTRGASPAAKKANPFLKRVKG